MTDSTSGDRPLDRIEELLLGRLEELPEAGWADAVAELCAQHPGEATGIRKRYAMMCISDPVAATPVAGPKIAGYRLLRRIGSGGMGVVHLAQQESTGREVVVKLIRPEFLDSERARERFHREVTAASSLDDPGICTVFEAGEADGIPYLVMRHVPGETLAERITRHRSAGGADGGDRQAILEAVALVESLARSLHVAHEAGLVHRDVKPANVIVQPDGRPVLLDFGLARAVDTEVHLTGTGELVGTPAYMSPEQISDTTSVDRRSDVYALGVTLYELLTGRLPFLAPTRDALYREILDGASSSVQAQNPTVPRDLAVVIATAMERDRDRRYATALAFAEDLRRVAALEPILARPANRIRRLQRWSQRNPVAATLTTTLAIALAVSIWLTVRGDRALARSRVDQLVLESQRVEAESPMLATFLAREAFVQSGGTDEKVLSRLRDATAGNLERALLKLPFDGGAWRACFGPDGETIWLAGKDAEQSQTAQLVRWRDGDAEIASITMPGPIADFDVRPAGGDVAVLCSDAGVFRVDAAGGGYEALTGVPADTTSLRFLDETRVLVGTAGGWLGVYEWSSGQLHWIVDLDAEVTELALSPDRGVAVAASRSGSLIRVDSLALTPRPYASAPPGVDWLRITDDGVVAARARSSMTLHVRHSDGSSALAIGGPRDQMSGCVLALEPPVVITGHTDQMVRIRDLDGGDVTALPGHSGWVFLVDASPDGKLIASGAGDGEVIVWDLAGRRRLQSFRIDMQPSLLRFFPDGDRILVASLRGPVRVFDLWDAKFPRLLGHRAAVRRCRAWPGAANPALVTVDATGLMMTWAENGAAVAESDGPMGYVSAFALAADGSSCVTFTVADRTLALWGRDLRSVASVRWPDCVGRDPAVAVNGRWILAVGRFGDQGRWRLLEHDGSGALNEVPVPDGLPPPPQSWALELSADGGSLLIGGADGRVRLFRWSGSTLEPAGVLQHGEGQMYVQALAFSADGEQILTGGTDSLARRWNRDGTTIGPVLVGHGLPIARVGFIPGGDEVVTMSDDQLRVWNRAGRCTLVIRPARGRFTDFALLPDGRRIAVASTDTAVRVFPLRAEDLVQRADERLAHREFSVEELEPFADLLGPAALRASVRAADPPQTTR